MPRYTKELIIIFFIVQILFALLFYNACNYCPKFHIHGTIVDKTIVHIWSKSGCYDVTRFTIETNPDSPNWRQEFIFVPEDVYEKYSLGDTITLPQ